MIFEVHSAQFKVPITGKAKKDPVGFCRCSFRRTSELFCKIAQGIKGIRPRASKALKDLAAAMVAVGEEAGSEAKQQAFVDECKDLEEFTEVSIVY